MKPFISDTAIVKNSDIGDDTKIWEFANIFGCKIGQNCTIGSYVEITDNVSIGNNNYYIVKNNKCITVNKQILKAYFSGIEKSL